MTETYIAFLRAINVGGRRVVMNDLIEHLTTLDDVEDVATYLASGNVSFKSSQTAAVLEQRIASHLEHALGFDVPTLVRSLDELHAITTSEVWAEEAALPNRKLHVTFLSEPLEDPAVLADLCSDVDTFQHVERDIFWLRDMDGESMNNYDIEKAIGIVGTCRTMNTIKRIVKKLSKEN